MKDFSERYKLHISSNAFKKGLDAKMKDFSEGYTLQLSSEASKKGFLLRHLKRDLKQK